MQISKSEIFGKGLSAIATPDIDLAATAAPKDVQAILEGNGIKISTAAFTDLEKLILEMKAESDNATSNIAKLRLASTLALLDANNISITAEQTKALGELTELNAQADALNVELNAIYNKYGATDSTYSEILQAKIETLEKAVERAVQEGKDHNEAVQKATEERDRAQAKLDSLENADKKDAAAIRDAKAALALAQGKLDAANAAAAGSVTAIAAAQAALESVKTDLATIATVKSKLSGLETQIGAVSAKLGNEVLAKVATILQETARDVTPGEKNESTEEARKREEKEIQNDPLEVIRRSMERIDQAIMRTIEGNRENIV